MIECQVTIGTRDSKVSYVEMVKKCVTIKTPTVCAVCVYLLCSAVSITSNSSSANMNQARGKGTLLPVNTLMSGNE